MRSTISKFAAGVCIWLCIGLGLLGLFLPLLPTTPFVLLAAWVASKTSPKYLAWIHNHPRFGPMVSAWKQDKSIPLSAKLLGVTLLTISAVTLLISPFSFYVRLFGVVFVFLIAVILITRPTTRKRD